MDLKKALKKHFGFDSFRPGQEETIKNIMENRDTLAVMPTGGGKCHPAGTKVIMYDGSIKNVENIIVGDKLMGPDNTPRVVLSLARGRDVIYNIIPHKGKAFGATPHHKISLIKTNEGKGYDNKPIIDVSIKEYLTWSKYKKHIYKLIRTGVDKFGQIEKQYKIPPYYLGMILGDGSLAHDNSVSVTKNDVEIQDACQELADIFDIKCVIYQNSCGCNAYRFSNKKRGPQKNPLKTALRELGLLPIACADKFIPKQYLYRNKYDRLELLAGLLDTDGYLGHSGYEFSCKSNKMADNVLFLARSLGLHAHHGKCGPNKLYNRIHISGDCSQIPLRIKRKKACKRRQRTNSLVSGFIIKKISDNEQYYGFQLDKDHRYLLEDFTITHNSMLYQLPALLKDGVTLVISPLISLMADQVMALKNRNLPATFLNSTLGQKEKRKIVKDIIDNKYKMVYVSPELLCTEYFKDIISQINVSLIAVDEAHLVSLWGHEFRKEYRDIGKIRRFAGDPSIVALTATATERVVWDITKNLEMKEPFIKIGGFDRPELTLKCEYHGYAIDKKDAFYNYFNSIYEKNGCFPPMIVYCGSRKDCEVLSKEINERVKKNYHIDDFSLPYHADMKKEDRQKTQELFMDNDISCIVGTIAIGMGIDKSNIRHILHYTIPGSIEAYYQEVGRAGRDGKPSECVLFYYPNDIRLRKYLIDISHPSIELYKRVYVHLLNNLVVGEENKITYSAFGQMIGKDNLERAQISTCLTELKKRGVFKAPKRGVMVLSDNVKSFDKLGIDFDLSESRKKEKLHKLEIMQRFVRAKDKRDFILDYFGVEK